MINYATYSYEENEHLYGPGKRLLLFTQGCSIRCKGCVNSHLWNFGEGTDATAEEIVRLCESYDIEGITLHGGEPLDQAEGLLEIAKSLKLKGKTVILFTGYTYKQLLLKSQRALWKIADIVVSGRYDESKRNIYLQFRGSTNQKIYLSGKVRLILSRYPWCRKLICRKSEKCYMKEVVYTQPRRNSNRGSVTTLMGGR